MMCLWWSWNSEHYPTLTCTASRLAVFNASSEPTLLIWLGFNDDPFDMELSVLPFTQCMTLEVHDIGISKSGKC